MMMITIDRGRRSSFKVADIPVIEERRGSVIEPRDISLSLSLVQGETSARADTADPFQLLLPITV